MDAAFVEMTMFMKYREGFFSDDQFSDFQRYLMEKPEAGEVIPGTGGLRKVRWAEKKRGKGKQGGVRVVYYRYMEGEQFWLFLVYSKGDMDDMKPHQKRQFRQALAKERHARTITTR